ncbi:hypothetical protein [Wuhan japanese halfbeak arterivirus]|uniref:Uncharacterized protein n=1 Tax=Wuhan japanese halfbeak arterivirus TaxID=2116443 RepID=A0A2P1GMX5_9NIDO|nr:hypothetical protein [Wuhan japanese halfbeak arterivirus]AVM87314.1 hypothetical protein [Wuhan japanese halfbeak arterivirus]
MLSGFWLLLLPSLLLVHFFLSCALCLGFSLCWSTS